MNDLSYPTAQGRKGKGGGGGSTPTVVDDNLLANSTAYIIGVLSEGEIEGLANSAMPDTCIYFDDTPLQNADGSYNFENVTYELRTGTPNQPSVSGFSAVELETQVAAKATINTPISRTISNQETDAARVKISVPTLIKITDSGDRLEAAVEFAIDVQAGSSGWTEVQRNTIQGKTTSGYQRSFRIELPPIRPVSVRVRRITADSNTTELQNDIYFASLTEIVDAKLQYPNTAYIAVSFPAKAFSGRAPALRCRIKGMRCLIPSNYDPIARTYNETTMWNGTFVRGWTRNPMWALYSLLVEKRWGLGDRIDPSLVDKWQAYEIAKYCDEMVPDANGGQEPRFSIDGPLDSRRSAYDWVTTLSSVMRGVTYWGAGAIVPVQDAPSDPVRSVVNADVVGGEFRYSGTPLTRRHTVAVASLRDTTDHFRIKPMVSYDDPVRIERYGERPVNLTLPFTISQAEALRAAKWAVDTDTTQTETVQFTGGMAYQAIRPGDVIAINDKHRVGFRLGGRIKDITANRLGITLDAPVYLKQGDTHQIRIASKLGDFSTYDVATQNGTYSQITLLQALPPEVKPAAVFSLESSSFTPKQFRVLSNRPNDATNRRSFDITAVENDPDKYARVEQGINLDSNAGHLLPPSGLPPKPDPLTLQPYWATNSGSASKLHVIASWPVSPDPRVVSYSLQIKEPDMAWRALAAMTGTSVDVELLGQGTGDVTVRVAAVTSDNVSSGWQFANFNTTNFTPTLQAPTNWQGVPGIQAVFLYGDSHPSPAFKAFRVYGAALSASQFAVLGETSDTAYVHRVDAINQTARYKITAIDHNGNESAETAEIVVSPTGVTGDLISQAVWDSIDTDSQNAVDRLEAAIDENAALALNAALQDFRSTAMVQGQMTEYNIALTAQVGGVRATLTQDYMTAATTNQAIASVATQLQADINGLSATLTQNYYTSAQVDQVTATAVTGVQTDVNGLNTTVTQLQTSVNGIEGTIGWEINNNGHVTGMGIMSQVVNGQPVGDVVFVADNFYIAAPNGSGSTTPMFSSFGQGRMVDNIFRPAGVYIKGAFIEELTVDTINIGYGAITLSFFHEGIFRPGNGVWHSEVISVPMAFDGQIIAVARAELTGTTSGSDRIDVQMIIDGNVVYDFYNEGAGAIVGHQCIQGSAQVPSGSRQIELRCQMTGVGASVQNQPAGVKFLATVLRQYR